MRDKSSAHWAACVARRSRITARDPFQDRGTSPRCNDCANRLFAPMRTSNSSMRAVVRSCDLRQGDLASLVGSPSNQSLNDQMIRDRGEQLLFDEVGNRLPEAEHVSSELRRFRNADPKCVRSCRIRSALVGVLALICAPRLQSIEDPSGQTHRHPAALLCLVSCSQIQASCPCISSIVATSKSACSTGLIARFFWAACASATATDLSPSAADAARINLASASPSRRSALVGCEVDNAASVLLAWKPQGGDCRCRRRFLESPTISSDAHLKISPMRPAYRLLSVLGGIPKKACQAFPQRASPPSGRLSHLAVKVTFSVDGLRPWRTC